MSQLYHKPDVPSGSPLDVLDFSMSEGGGNPHKYPPHNGQDSMCQQLLSNLPKPPHKYSDVDYLDNSTDIKYMNTNSENLNVPTLTSVIDIKPFNQGHLHTSVTTTTSTTTTTTTTSTGPENKIQDCPYCPYKSNRSCNLTNHLQTHYVERPYAEPSCSYCSTLNNYKMERMSTNLENQMHPCMHCSVYFPSVEEAVKHLKSHLDESTCICRHAQRNEEEQPEIFQPKKEVEETFQENKKASPISKQMKNFQCPDCSYVAHRAQNLKRHLITHTGERPHSCTACPYRAPDVSSLRVHMKTHTGERPYDCPHCSYKASQKSTLRNHLKVHTGEKPYPCTYCSYRSSNQTNLNSHIKTHTGEKPYACPHCSYCATQSSALKCHLRIHTGEKPFACTQCSYKAAALGNLRSHQKIHANNKEREDQ